MSAPRIGALFAGYGGLDLAVQSVVGGSLVWVSEFDKGANKILAHRFPDVPNHGDITKIDWSQVEPVDILTGGSPCQDLSHAGKRSGMTEGTRSNLWVAMREAIAQLRPGLVVWENVRGAYSAGADSALEHCPGCMGETLPDSQPVLRALGRVLGDLSDLGYDCRWHGLRAADVGAPHGRFRVFVVAYPSRSSAEDIARRNDARRAVVGTELGAGAGANAGSLAPRVPHLGRGARLLPSPRTSDTNGAGEHGEGGVDLRTAVALLPTPRATDGPKGGPNQRGSSGDLMLPSAVTLLPTPSAADGSGAGRYNSDGHQSTLPGTARLLPTPTSMDCNSSGGGYNGQTNVTLIDAAVRKPQDWGIYADAIARWEALTRPAPAPTQPSKKGTPQLSAAFSEWMMGLPAGWVTDVPGITRNEALKALGNGVVPAQAEAALRFLLSVQAVAA